MTLNELIEEVKKQCSTHEELDDLIQGLEHNPGVYQAKRLASKNFQNIKLSKELYKILLKEADGEIGSLASIAESIAAEDGLNDKEWAKAICSEIINTPMDYYDGISIARLLIALGDSESAQMVFQKALDTADDFYELLNICKMYIHGKDEYQWEDFNFLNLNDDAKARVFIEKAIKVADTPIHLQQLANIVGREKNALSERGLNDKSWAKIIFKSSYDMKNDFYDLKQLAELLIDAEVVDLGNVDDENWIKEIYKKGLDLGDSSDKKELKKSMKSRDIKLK